MLSKDILDHIVNGNSTEARGMTVNLLQAKLSELMAQKYDEIAPTVFGETKKEQKKAPVTDKDDDGEGMDPVGQEDDDVDNDGDSDSRDKYLKNRRKVVSKAIKQDEQVGARSAGQQRGGKMTYGVRDVEFKGAGPEQQSRMKSRYYQDKERQTRDAERERKQKQREREAKQRERGVRPT